MTDINESVQSSVHTWWRSSSIGMAVLLSERRTCASSSKLIWEKYFGSVIGTPVDGKAFRQQYGFLLFLVNMIQGETITRKHTLTRY